MKITEIITENNSSTLSEKWSQKYKSSINCSHPKGFSQKAHCAGKKKHNESVEMEMVCEDCGMCQTHGDHTKDKLDELKCWSGFHRVAGTKAGFPGSCAKNKTNEEGVAEGYSNTTFNVDRRKLNVPALIQKGAILVTHPHGEQGWETDNKEDWAFSLLSLYNVLQGGWPNEAKKYLKPQSYKRAEQQINSSAPNLGSDKLVYDGKYNQILWSIKKLGIPDNVAFLDKDKQGVAEEKCPHCNGPMFSELMINEKKDACYYKVKSRYKVWPSAYASGALVKCRKKGADSWGNGGKSNESIEDLDENLHKWFKEKWVRFGPDGKIRGDCARDDDSEGKPKCLPQSKAHSLGKQGRASAAARKRREDPNPERSGPAINVNTKKKTSEGVAEDAEQLFDMIEEMVESLAAAKGVDAEQIWEDFEHIDDAVLLDESAAWHRKAGKNKNGGLNAKGVASYRREHPGSHLQTAVTTKPSKLKPGSKAAKRRKSFCARMSGVKGPMKKPNGKPTRKALSLRKWNC
jgi:hypothetical protein